MTKDEALDLALEALEHMLEDAKQERLTVEYWNECVDAITAIKQARSAPVQEPVAWEYTTSYVPNPDRDNGVRVTSELRVAQVNALPGSIKPLGYTTPPAAQRQWVGLTDEEFEDIELGCRSTSSGKIEAMQKVEAKLKEKNT